MAKFFRDENHYQFTLHCLWKCSQEPWETLVLNYNRHSIVHITGTVLHSPIVGKGGFYHPTSQGFNYTNHYQPLKITHLLSIRKTSWNYNFWYKKPSPWAFPSDQRLCRLSSALYSMGNKISESRFSCVPHLPIHGSTKMHPANTGIPVIHAHKHISFLLAQAGYLQLPFLCIGQCIENLTLWKTSPSDKKTDCNKARIELADYLNMWF